MNGQARQFIWSGLDARVWLVVALCFTVLMPSNDSIWIDEAQTAAYAKQPTFQAWLHRLSDDKFSEAQMPLGMAVAWMGGKVLGTTEWQLRAINVIWVAAAIWIVWLIGCRLEVPALAVVAAVQPFLWFYANEARPYSLQIAGGACLLLASVEFIANDGRGIRWVCLWAIAALILCASSMLGVIPVAVVSVWIVTTLLRRRLLPGPMALVVTGFTCAILAALGCYYLWTLKRGAGGAALWPVGFANLAFSAYELLGFAGLGPARQALRDAGVNGALRSSLLPHLFLLGVFGLATFVIVGRSLQWFAQPLSRLSGFLFFGVPVICALALFALAKTVHFPFWGRHLAPVFPFLIVGLGAPALLSQRRVTRIACVSWILLSFLSALEIRFAPRHAKDDNRSATAVAKTAVASGQVVWWAADERSAQYYGLEFCEVSCASGSLFLSNISEEAFRALPTPDLIFTSKPEVFDSKGRIGQYVSAHSYFPAHQFQAITGWVKR